MIDKVKQTWKNKKTYLKLLNNILFISSDGHSWTALKEWMKIYGTCLISIEVENKNLIFKTIK